MSYYELARAYHSAVHAAAAASVNGEEEAQLTTPVSNLFCGMATQGDLGVLQLIRETRLDRTRPDFAAILTEGGITRHKGFIELKAPSVPVDTTRWTGRNARQWERLREEAEVLIVCNGVEAQVYHDGEAMGTAAPLPYHGADMWEPAPLAALLQRFVELNPTPVTDVATLSRRLATRTADLRDRLLWLLDQAGDAGELAQGSLRAWQQHVYAHAEPRDFADGISQVIAYGMVLAVLGVPNTDTDHDSLITVSEARSAIRQSSPVLAAAFAPLIDRPPWRRPCRSNLRRLKLLLAL